MNKHWYSVELPAERAARFQEYMKTHGIPFEPSSAYSNVHMQCYMTEQECELANKWLDNNIYVN